MLTTLKNAFKIKELRNRVLFVLGMLVVIRIGSQLPAPGINGEIFKNWFETSTAGSFSFFDAITGGSFSQMAVLALGINPYITSSIIMQLLTIAIPKLEELQNDGEDGRKKIASITRYVTVLLALIQPTCDCRLTNRAPSRRPALAPSPQDKTCATNRAATAQPEATP